MEVAVGETHSGSMAATSFFSAASSSSRWQPPTGMRGKKYLRKKSISQFSLALVQAGGGQGRRNGGELQHDLQALGQQALAFRAAAQAPGLLQKKIAGILRTTTWPPRTLSMRGTRRPRSR